MKYLQHHFPMGFVFASAIAISVLQGRAAGPGITDTEIKIGQTMPYSGPASAYSTIGKAEGAYFKMVNDEGGIAGRKINLISLDDSYSPPKTIEQVRRLVESDEVLGTFQTLGTAANAAIQKYMNNAKVPMLFVATGAARFTDPKHFPWTMGYNPNYRTEGHIYAQYILREKPNAKIAVLYQNDDFGRDYVTGLKEGLGRAASSMIVSEATYEVTDPTIDSQIIKLRASGADLLYDITTPKFAAQTIRKVAELNWSPAHVLNVNSVSVGEVLKPAGLENAKGIVSVIYGKDPSDPTWKDDPGMKAYFEFMDKYYPEGNRESFFNAYGFEAANLLVHVLRQCGNELTRDNLMKQATNIRNYTGPLSLPGTTINTSPDDYRVLKQFQMVRFDGTRWKPFGGIVTDEAKM